MANGFFLGGASEGIQSANKQALAEQTLAQDTALRGRGLDLQSRSIGVQERAQSRIEQQSVLERADKAIADTMGTVSETIKAGLAAGKDPQMILRAVQPLVDSAKAVGAKVGQNPGSFDAKVQALFGQPDLMETAAATGTAKAVASVAEDKALTAAGGDPGATKWKDPKDRVGAENSLRDDYLKASSQFITMRDAKTRLDSIEKTGAGDMALVFTYMKLLDPGSTVREGEYATASNAGGVPSAVQGLYNKMIGGGVLGDAARNQIKSQANKFYEKAANQHDKLTTQFADTAKRQGLRINNVVVDLAPASKPDPLGIR